VTDIVERLNEAKGSEAKGCMQKISEADLDLAIAEIMRLRTTNQALQEVIGSLTPRVRVSGIVEEGG
jgi:hypothetical protein